MLFNLKKNVRDFAADKKFSEILTGSSWALVAQILATVFAFISSVIVARFYGPDVVGIVAVITSFLLLVTTFTVFGTNTSILRLIPEHLSKYSPTSAFRVFRKVQFLVLGTAIVTSVLFFFGSDFVADKVFSKPHLSFHFALSAVFVLFNSLVLFNTSAVQGLKHVKAFALMRVFPSTCNLAFLILLTIFLFSPDSPVYAYLVSLALTGILGWVIIEYTFKGRMQPKDQVHRMTVSSILSISLPMLMTQTMNLVIGQIGVIMLCIFRTEVEVGYYAIAVKLATLTSFVLTAINSIAAPKFSELFHVGKMDELFYVAQKSAKLIFWTTIPILLMLVLLGRPILEYTFGGDFIQAYPAMILLIAGQFINSVSGSTGYFMNMTGHQKMFRNIVLVAASLNIVLNFVFIPLIGIIGAALAGMTSLIFWNICTLIYIKTKYGRMIAYIPFWKGLFGGNSTF